MIETTQRVQSQQVSHRFTLTGAIYVENCRGDPWVARNSRHSLQDFLRFPAQRKGVNSPAPHWVR